MLKCCYSGEIINQNDIQLDISPDSDFLTDQEVVLSNGKTAFKLLEPTKRNSSTVIVCLHGMWNCSYMWLDVAELLTEFEQGPRCRVLVLDFYGHGRSPWNGIPLTLDVLVSQVKDLLDYLGLSTCPIALIGYDLGGAVAAGFSAKFTNICSSLCLISPLGIKLQPIKNEKIFHRKYLGEIVIYRQRFSYLNDQELDYFDQDATAPHRKLIDKQIAMVRWQIVNTPGYLGAILSTFRNFPVRGMEELFTAIGRHPRKVLIVWGDKDVVCPYKKCIKVIEESFPQGSILDVVDCGHNCVAEKFDDVMREILKFHREESEGS